MFAWCFRSETRPSSGATSLDWSSRTLLSLLLKTNTPWGQTCCWREKLRKRHTHPSFCMDNPKRSKTLRALNEVYSYRLWIFPHWKISFHVNLQVERLVPLASKAELTEFGHLFVARTRRNLSDSHLWFSVLARPANSRFTRVQRLSCCLCLLFMSMMASGMYYDRQDDPSNVQNIGSVVFTWNQVSFVRLKLFSTEELTFIPLCLSVGLLCPDTRKSLTVRISVTI